MMVTEVPQLTSHLFVNNLYLQKINEAIELTLAFDKDNYAENPIVLGQNQCTLKISRGDYFRNNSLLPFLWRMVNLGNPGPSANFREKSASTAKLCRPLDEKFQEILWCENLRFHYMKDRKSLAELILPKQFSGSPQPLYNTVVGVQSRKHVG